MILIISPEPWNAHAVSKHHYALQLARNGHDVVFYGPPEDDFRDMRLETVRQSGATVSVLHAARVAPGVGRMPPLIRRFLERRWLKRLDRLVGRPIDIVWLFENSRFFDMSFAEGRRRIYQQVDLNQDFHPVEAARSADLAIALSEPIERRIRPAAPHYLRLGHGVATLEEAPVAEAALNERFPSDMKHAVLVGNLDIPYLDIELLADLVADNPSVRFHFVGGYKKDKRFYQSLGAAPNVVWWGFQPAEALPSILRRADVLLLAYLAEKWRDQLANPHKLLEYLASGRPVLTTETLEYATRPDLVHMATDRASYRQLFLKCLAENSKDATERRRRFAAEQSYSNQIKRIELAWVSSHRSALFSAKAKQDA